MAIGIKKGQGMGRQTKRFRMWKSGKRWLYGAMTIVVVAGSYVESQLLPLVSVIADVNGINDLTVETDDIMSQSVSDAMATALSGERYTGIIKSLKWHNGESVEGVALTTVAVGADTVANLYPGNEDLAVGDNILPTDAAYDTGDGTDYSFVIQNVGLYVGNDGTKRPVNMRVTTKSFSTTSTADHSVVYAVKGNGGTITIAAMARYQGALSMTGSEGGSSSGAGGSTVGYGRLPMTGFSYQVQFEFEPGVAIPASTAFGAKFSEIDAAQSVAIDTNGLEGIIRRNDSALTKVGNGLANDDPTATTADSGSLSRTSFLAIYKGNRMTVDYTSNLSSPPLDIVTSLFGESPDVPESVVDQPQAPEPPQVPKPPTTPVISVDSPPVMPQAPILPELVPYAPYPTHEVLQQTQKPVKDVLDQASLASIDGKKTLTDVGWLWKVSQKLDAHETAYSDYQGFVAQVQTISRENDTAMQGNLDKKRQYDDAYRDYGLAFETYLAQVQTHNAKVLENQASWAAYDESWSRYLESNAQYVTRYGQYESAYRDYQSQWNAYVASGGTGTIAPKASQTAQATKAPTPSDAHFTTLIAESKAMSQSDALIVHNPPAAPNQDPNHYLFDGFRVTDQFDLNKVTLGKPESIYVQDENGQTLDTSLYSVSLKDGLVVVNFEPSFVASDAFYARGNDNQGYQVFVPSLTNIDDQAEVEDAKQATNQAVVTVEPNQDEPTNEVTVTPIYTEAAIAKSVMQYDGERTFDALLASNDWQTLERLKATDARYAYKVQYDLGNHADYATVTLSDPWFADIQVAPDELAVYATVTSSKGKEKERTLLVPGQDYQVIFEDSTDRQTDGEMANTQGFKIDLSDVSQYARKTTRFEVILKDVTISGMSAQESYQYLNNADSNGPNGPQHETVDDHAMHIYNTARLDYEDKTADEQADKHHGRLISNTTEVIPPVVGPQTQKFVELEMRYESKGDSQ
jgi:hypothetical protein